MRSQEDKEMDITNLAGTYENLGIDPNVYLYCSSIEKGLIERMPNGVPNGYSQAKLEFVKKYTNSAKQEFHDRYKPR